MIIADHFAAAHALPSDTTRSFMVHDLGSPRHKRRGAALFLLPCMTLWLAGCAIPTRMAPTTVPFERIEATVRIAQAQWLRWGSQDVWTTPDGEACAVVGDGDCQPVADGCGREMTAALCPAVNEYWRALGNGNSGPDRHACTLTDVCEAVWPAELGTPAWSPPWSAAFISAVLRQAGFSESEFAFGAAHARYVVAARDHKASAFDVVATPTLVNVGDLVCAPRTEDASQRQMRIDEIRDDEVVTPMHCDLVVSLAPQAHTLDAIGGNVQQSVSRSVIALDADNRLSWSPLAERGWILVMKPHRDYTPARP